MLNTNSLFLLCCIAFILLGKLFAVNLSCDARLRECESEVKSLLKKNGECSSDLDSLKVEVSHLSEMVFQCERNVNFAQDSHHAISWRIVVNQLKNFSMFFKGLIAASYSNIPKELESQIRSTYGKFYVYLDPVIEKYSEVYPLICKHMKIYMNRYVNLLNPYIESVLVYSEFINEKLDRYVARIESYEPNIAGTIPKSLHDRIFYILCALLALYVVLESILIALRLIFRCCGIKCNSCTNKKSIKSPASKSTPSNRRK
ncbi:uncharacterized protein ELE39_001194 [Cryptosporidium sp. chipmunk genotype I]|uniref:uncharacterized protein n=1 Tax=Cryptosporidium sp. chipmunk genotype I TaxID=1280935 RepID=UPI00351A8E57|nr:hypothetical protein ELE39_001194 [Cryptosporidium sp. chipmunk genotype I]